MKGHPQHWRVFFGVELPEEVRARAAEHASRLRREFGRVRASWERPEKFHLTLKFIGETVRPRVEDLRRAAELAAEASEPFTLTLAGAGAFPPRGPARVLWLGVRDAAGRLAALALRLEDECARAGFTRESRSFHPHLTLARLRDPRSAGALTAAHLATHFESEPFIVNRLLVVRSELAPGGSHYTTVSHHALGASGGEEDR